MQLTSDTIKELIALKSAKEKKMQARRSEILNYISVDSKYNVTIDPAFRGQETKAILNDLDKLATDICDIDTLSDEIKEASAALGFSDFGQQRQRFMHTIQQSNMTLQKGIINGILSKAQCSDLEITVNTAKESLAKLESITAPISEKLEKLDISK